MPIDAFFSCRRWITLAIVTAILPLAMTGCRGEGQESTPHRTPTDARATSPSQARIPEPISWAFPAVVESARAISPTNVEGRTFDEHGLAYSIAELEALPVATMNAHELQKYADIVTHAYPDAAFRRGAGSGKDLPLERLNNTGVANAAYVSLHAVDADTRQRAAIYLEQIQVRLKDRQSAE
jgi:hypothetical protein